MTHRRHSSRKAAAGKGGPAPSTQDHDRAVLARPIFLLDDTLAPEEAARAFAASFWPSPRQFLAILPLANEIYLFRLEKIGCWYKLQKVRPIGKDVWGVFRLECRWGRTL